jgi:hypothetical protein
MSRGKKKELSWYNGGVQEKHTILKEYDGHTTIELIEELKKYPDYAKVDFERENDYYDSINIYLTVEWYRDPTPEELDEKVAKDKRQKADREQAEYRQLNELAKRLGKKVV